MVPKEFRKSLCVAAGWITLLEAAIWEAASIYSIGLYGCTWNLFSVEKGVSVWTRIYISYFMGICRGEVAAQQLGYVMTPPTDAARFLQVWMWIYAIFSAVWIPACILLLVAAKGEVRGSAGAYLYYPWIGFTAAITVIDLVGAVFHLVDVFDTTTPDDYAKFTGSSNWKSLTMNSSSEGVVTWLPSLYMTLFFCRLVVIWILNIYFLHRVYKASNSVSLYKTNYIQPDLMTREKRETWKDKFYQGPDPTVFEQQSTTNTQHNETEETRPRSFVDTQKESQPAKSEDSIMRHDLPPVRYKMDEFGIPIEELNHSEKEGSHNLNNEKSARSPYQPTGRVFDFTGRPVREESFSDRWRDNPPPMASGVQVPPELNKFEPFSYMAGDQPQLIRRPFSRSNSKSEYPSIPRPDYTIADRRHASLEYVPNRFTVPSPTRIKLQSSFTASPPNSPRSPTLPKVPPIPPKKPQVYPRSRPYVPENPEMAPQTRYLPQQAIPNQQQAFYTRQTSQNSNYNINKLY